MAGETHPIMTEKLRLRPWREVAILMLIMMEVSWVTPWFRSLTPSTYAIQPTLAFLVLMLLMATSHLVVRVMEALHLKFIIRRWLTIGLLAGNILIGLQVLLYAHERVGIVELFNRPLRSMLDLRTIIPDEFIIILVVLVGWWRGISLAQEHIEPSSVMGYFRLGIFMFLGFIFFNTLVTGETPGGFIYLFLFCSVIAMTTARISVLRTLRGGKQSNFDRRWFFAVMGAAGGMVLLAAGLAEVLGDRVGWFGIIIMGIFGVLAVLILALISPILVLIIYLLGRLDSNSLVIDQLVKTIENIQAMIQGLFRQISGIIDQSELWAMLSLLLPYLKASLLISILLLVVVGVLAWVAMRLWKDYQRKRITGDEQSLLEGGDVWRMLQAFLRQRWQNLMEGMANVIDIRRRQRARAAARIRQIYSDLLDLGEELGCARPEPKTPLEFMPSLELSIPAVDVELELITNAYLRVRYGQLPENHQEVESVETAWRTVEKAGKEKLTERTHRKSPPARNDDKGEARQHL